MSSVGRDIAETLSRLGTSYGVEQFAQIMQIINRRTTPQDEDDALIKHVIYSPLIDIMNTSVTFAEADIESTDPLEGYSGWGMRKFLPDEVRTYDQTHNNTNATGITFPTPGIGDFNPSTIGVKHMGAGQTDGSSYMIVNNDAWWNVTDEIMMCGWFYPKAITSGTEIVAQKDTQYRLQVTATNKFQFTVWSESFENTIEYTFTPDTWIQFVAQYRSSDGSMELHIDNTLEDSTTVPTERTRITEGGTTRITEGSLTRTIETISRNIPSSTNNFTLFGDGTNNLANGNALSWFSIANGYADSTWISNYFTKGLMDYDTDVAGTPEEITTWPFIGSLQEMPNAFEGMFIAS